jgi:hypothetical protein
LNLPTSAKARVNQSTILHGPKGPFFHHFFTLKREEQNLIVPAGNELQ